LWTVGCGHVIDPNHARVPFEDRNSLEIPAGWNRKLSMDEVNAILAADLQRFERGVLRYCPSGITQGRFDALVSFAFNVGLGTLQRSTLRQKHNRGDFEGAAEEFLKYSKAGGKVLKGLLNRRKDERAIYLM
jgi:lysozyme